MKIEDLIAGREWVLVDFYADWCEPCKWADPVMEDVISKLEVKPILVKVNIDIEPDLAREFHILSVPTFLLFKNGSEAWRIRGFDTVSKMLGQLKPILEKESI